MVVPLLGGEEVAGRVVVPLLGGEVVAGRVAGPLLGDVWAGRVVVPDDGLWLEGLLYVLG